jgi:hypothetical protein
LARQIDPGLGLFRLPGEYERILHQERRRVIECHPAVDPRVLLEITDPDEREAAWAEARAHPLASDLLDRLELGEPVIVDYHEMSREFFALRRRPDAPEWTLDFRNVRRVRVYQDDVIAPVYDD